MKIKSALLLSLLPILSFLFIGTTFAKTMNCPVNLFAKFEAKRCTQNNFFEEDGPDLIRKINSQFDQKLDLIFRDNIAHPTYETKEIIKDITVYHQCFTSLCQKITTDCSGVGTQGSILQQELDWCQTKRDQFFELQKAKIEYYVIQNTSRKYRSLHEEKMARIGYRFYKYIHTTSMKNILRSFRYAVANITHLVRYPR